MRNFLKTPAMVLSLAFSISCLTLFSAAQQFQETSVNDEIVEDGINYKMSTENSAEDHENRMSEYVSSFVELVNKTEQIDKIIQDVQTLSEDIKISDVQIFKSISDFEEGNRISDGYAFEGTVVKIFYDDGKSWIEHTKVTPLNDLSLSEDPGGESRNVHGFILPLSSMNLNTHITCLFPCSSSSGCSKCYSDGSGTWRRNPHNGIDVAWGGINGTSIRAVRAGTVTKGNDVNGWGNWVKIAHTNGLHTLYAHMQSASSVSGSVSQGATLGAVGSTGNSSGPHLHFEVYTSSSTRVDPMPYLRGVNPAATKTFKIVDGPLTIRASASTSSTSYGTLANGTSVSITNVQVGGSFIFGKISSGTHNGRWIAIGTVSGAIYAADLTSTWMVVDGPLTIRATASTASTSYGTIANGTTFTINDTALYGSYVFGKISSGTHSGRWVALSYGSSKYCMTPNY